MIYRQTLLFAILLFEKNTWVELIVVCPLAACVLASCAYRRRGRQEGAHRWLVMSSCNLRVEKDKNKWNAEYVWPVTGSCLVACRLLVHSLRLHVVCSRSFTLHSQAILCGSRSWTCPVSSDSSSPVSTALGGSFFCHGFWYTELRTGFPTSHVTALPPSTLPALWSMSYALLMSFSLVK